MLKEIVFVPGLAVEVEDARVPSVLASLFPGVEHTFLNGVVSEEDGCRAILPSEQEKQVTKLLKPGCFVISQSLGAIGVVNALRAAKDIGAIHALLIAPPAPRPFDIMLHPHVRDRWLIDNTTQKTTIKSFSHPEGVYVSPAYFEEVAEADMGFHDDLLSLTNKGIVSIIAPDQDWNTAYLGGLYQETHSVRGTHSLVGTGDQDLFTACDDIRRVIGQA